MQPEISELVVEDVAVNPTDDWLPEAPVVAAAETGSWYRYEAGDWWRIPVLLAALSVAWLWHKTFPTEHPDDVGV